MTKKEKYAIIKHKKNIKGLIMNMETMKEFFDGMDLNEAEALFKAYKKQRKAAEKAEKIHKAKKNIEVGAT